MTALSGLIALWALVALPAVAGALLCLAGAALGRRAWWVGVATAAVALVLALVAAAGRREVSAPFVAGGRFALEVDGLSAVVIVTVAVIALMVLVFSGADPSTSTARFQGLVLLFVAAVMVTATATTLVGLLAAWEVMGATSYALIGYWWRDTERVSAGAVSFVTTRTADLGLYAAAGAALAGGGGWTLSGLVDASPGWRSVVAAGLLVGALGKAAQLPFSFWLSRAMQGPSAVSALLHSAAMVAMGAYLLLRIAPLLQVTGWAAWVAAWAGALTALLLGVVALAQSDLKQLLAASTAAQLGFVVSAAGAGAVAGGTGQLLAHATTKAALFLAAGAWLEALGTKRLAGLRGAARRWPVTGALAAVALLSLAGAPPLSLWLTKDEVLAGALDRSVALYLVLLAAAGLSAAYAGKALVQIWRHELPGTRSLWDAEQRGTRELPWPARLPIALLAVGAVAAVLLVLPPTGEALRSALGATGEPSSGPVELTVSAALALAVLAAVVVAARRGGESVSLAGTSPLIGRFRAAAWARDWWRLGDAADALVVRPTTWAAQALARFDDRVIDRGTERLAGSVMALAVRSGVVDVEVVDAAVEGAARGARRAGSLARRPQTGQLHHYYLQAVAVLAGGVVVLLVVR